MNKNTIIYAFVLLLLLSLSFAEIAEILDQAVPVSYCGNRYELEAVYIAGDQVKFRLNNETSDILGRHELFRFQEGSSIYVREILEEEAKEGPDRVSIRFYPRVCIEPDAAPEEKIEEPEEAPEKPEEIREISEEEPPEEIIPPEEKELSFFDLFINWLKSLFIK